MSVKVPKNRLILSSSLQGSGELYQYLVGRICGIQSFGDLLIEKAETARVFRITNDLETFAAILSNFPVKEYRLIGHYYQGLSGCWRGENPRQIFEDVFEGSHTYKAKALIGLAALEAQKGNYDSELHLFTQALKFTTSLSLSTEIYRSIAVVKAKEGFHPQSLKDLEKISSWLRYASPYVRCQYYNSLAVELGEAGRIEEARNISNIVLASPYVIAYPEWRETSEEINLRGYRTSRSILSLNHSALNLNNVLRLPLPEHNIESGSEHLSRSPSHQQASVTSLQEWKSKMGKEPNGNDELDFSKMTDKEKLFKIIELSSNEDITDDQLDRILDAVIRITSKRP